jgi:hypothetical protein
MLRTITQAWWMDEVGTVALDKVPSVRLGKLSNPWLTKDL